MLAACYTHAMAAIQIKDVPERIHDLARRRAERLDLTLGEYVLSLIRNDLERSDVTEWRQRMLARPVTNLPSGLVQGLLDEGRTGS
jgi:hypothetical protein